MEPTSAEFTLPYIRQFSAAGESGDYRVFVALPEAPPPSQGYAVLYLLDGNAWIAGAAEASRLQSRFSRQSEIEPMVLVAVGYPGDEPFDLGRRAYDYLPKHTSEKLSERFMQGAPWHQPGGAGPFLDFLTGPLRDDISRRYPVDRDKQYLCGHSFGGFFALWTLLNRPGAFRKYVSLSPSLWWDDSRLMKEADTLVRGLPGDMSRDVMIAVGSREAPDRPALSELMVSLATDMSDRLRKHAPSSFNVDFRILPGENHQSAPVAALPALLRFVSAQQNVDLHQRSSTDSGDA